MSQCVAWAEHLFGFFTNSESLKQGKAREEDGIILASGVRPALARSRRAAHGTRPIA